MASHAGHDHPATPAARAACRRTGGAQVAPKATVEATQRPTKATARATRTRDTVRRVIASTGDLGGLAVPHAFSSVIRWAWDRGLEVRTGDIYTDDQRSVTITSDHGWLTLTWRSTQPNGVHAVSYRPRGTSVATQLPTVNEGMRALDGHWLD